MSKLAKKPIAIPEGVKVEVSGKEVKFAGKDANLALPVLDYTDVQIKDNQIFLSKKAGHKQAAANLGTMAALVKNALVGVSQGFSKSLEIEGIGFKAALEGKTLVVNAGFTHPVKFEAPGGVKVTVEKNIIKVSGIDKGLVGQVAAQIKKIRKPEPYKGKGIHYVGEVVRRKEGKKVAGAGTTA